MYPTHQQHLHRSAAVSNYLGHHQVSCRRCRLWTLAFRPRYNTRGVCGIHCRPSRSVRLASASRDSQCGCSCHDGARDSLASQPCVTWAKLNKANRFSLWARVVWRDGRVESAAVQIAKCLGCHVAATCSKSHKESDRVKSYGADVILCRDEDYPDPLSYEATYDVILTRPWCFRP
jgi:hypothetical protein